MNALLTSTGVLVTDSSGNTQLVPMLVWQSLQGMPTVNATGPVALSIEQSMALYNALINATAAGVANPWCLPWQNLTPGADGACVCGGVSLTVLGAAGLAVWAAKNKNTLVGLAAGVVGLLAYIGNQQCGSSCAPGSAVTISPTGATS